MFDKKVSTRESSGVNLEKKTNISCLLISQQYRTLIPHDMIKNACFIKVYVDSFTNVKDSTIYSVEKLVKAECFYCLFISLSGHTR